MSRRFTLMTGAALMALAIACSRQSASPTSPSGSAAASAAAAADGSTLKVSAPALVSPVNDAQQTDAPTVTARAAAGKYSDALPGALT